MHIGEPQRCSIRKWHREKDWTLLMSVILIGVAACVATQCVVWWCLPHHVAAHRCRLLLYMEDKGLMKEE